GGGAAGGGGVGLGAGSARDRLGVLGIAHADPAFGPGEQVVLAFGPLTVVPAGLVGAGPAGGADLLPAGPGFHGVVEHRRVPVVAGQHLADGHVLQALGPAQRLAGCRPPVAPGGPGRIARPPPPRPPPR